METNYSIKAAINKLVYPNCTVDNLGLITNGKCDNYGLYNTIECGFDGGDCATFNIKYPNCKARHPSRIQDGNCDDSTYYVAECGWDGNDCSTIVSIWIIMLCVLYISLPLALFESRRRMRMNALTNQQATTSSNVLSDELKEERRELILMNIIHKVSMYHLRNDHFSFSCSFIL